MAGDEVLLSYQPHMGEVESAGASPVGSVAKEKAPHEFARSRKKKKRSRAVEEPVMERDPFGRMFTTDPGYRIPKRKKTTAGEEEIAEPLMNRMLILHRPPQRKNEFCDDKFSVT